MSYATFGYTHGGPERLWLTLTDYSCKRKDDESDKEFLTRSLKTKTENSELTENEKKQILEKINQNLKIRGG